LSTTVLQGSVAMRVNYGRIFIDFIIANLLLSVMVKEFWISVRIWHSYGKQDAQLSQRDRTAECVIVFAKSTTLEMGDNDLRTL